MAKLRPWPRLGAPFFYAFWQRARNRGSQGVVDHENGLRKCRQIGTCFQLRFFFCFFFPKCYLQHPKYPKSSQIHPTSSNISGDIARYQTYQKKTYKKNGLISGDACLPWELKEIQWRVWAVSRSRIPHQEVPGFLERVSTLQKA